MCNAYDKIHERISNRRWDSLREKMNLPDRARVVRDDVWNRVCTRAWAQMKRGNVRQNRTYRRFP